MLFGNFAKGYKTVRFRIKAYFKVGACTEDIEDDGVGRSFPDQTTPVTSVCRHTSSDIIWDSNHDCNAQRSTCGA